MTVLRVLRRLLRWGLGDCGPFRGDGEIPANRLYVECEYLKINVGMQLDICKVKEGGYTAGVSPSALEQPLEERRRRRRRQHNERWWWLMP